MNTPNPPDNYEIIPADFLRKHGAQEGMKYKHKDPLSMPRYWIDWMLHFRFTSASFTSFIYAAPVGTMARVLAESGEPVASETPLALIEAMQADFRQHAIDSLTPDRGYGFPTDNTKKLFDALETRARAAEECHAASAQALAEQVGQNEKLRARIAASEAGAAALREALSVIRSDAWAVNSSWLRLQEEKGFGGIKAIVENIRNHSDAALATASGAATLKELQELQELRAFKTKATEWNKLCELEMKNLRMLNDGLDEDLKLSKQEALAIRHSVVETIGCVDYDGNPTSIINYLQRLRILLDKEKQLTAARALADRLGEDKARLDWLGCKANIGRIALGPRCYYVEGLGDEFPTLRQAIDAALKGAK